VKSENGIQRGRKMNELSILSLAIKLNFAKTAAAHCQLKFVVGKRKESLLR